MNKPIIKLIIIPAVIVGIMANALCTQASFADNALRPAAYVERSRDLPGVNPELTGGEIVGNRYKIKGSFRSNGPCTTYEAEDTAFNNERVFIKTFDISKVATHGDYGNDIMAKKLFEQEIDILWDLRAENDCPTARIKASGKNWFATEWIEGQTLDKVNLKNWPAKDILNLFLKILAALGRVHDKGIVHRDLKPGNIMLTSSGEVKIIDFGIAKKDLGFDTPYLWLSPGYVSPELYVYNDAIAKSDLYQASLILYEMITGATALLEVSSLGDLVSKTAMIGKMGILSSADHLRRRMNQAFSVRKMAMDSAQGNLIQELLVRFLSKGLSVEPYWRYESTTAMAGGVMDMLQSIEFWEQRHQRHMELLEQRHQRTLMVEAGV